MRIGVKNGVGEDSPQLVRGLTILRNAHQCALDTSCNPWEFAVEISTLLEAGLSKTDLRWLVRKGLAQHGEEITAESDCERQFALSQNLQLSEQSCFILLPDGSPIVSPTSDAPVANGRADKAHPSVAGNGHVSSSNGHSPTSNGSLRGSASARSTKPRWNSETRELWFGELLVKRFKWQAINQEMILATFEEEGWPPVVDDPLPPKDEVDSKRRLHDTIKALNRSQENELLSFHGNGTGEGIRWETMGNPS